MTYHIHHILNFRTTFLGFLIVPVIGLTMKYGLFDAERVKDWTTLNFHGLAKRGLEHKGVF